jgi:hypothetical protein
LRIACERLKCDSLLKLELPLTIPPSPYTVFAFCVVGLDHQDKDGAGHTRMCPFPLQGTLALGARAWACSRLDLSQETPFIQPQSASFNCHAEAFCGRPALSCFIPTYTTPVSLKWRYLRCYIQKWVLKKKSQLKACRFRPSISQVAPKLRFLSAFD